MITRSIEGHEVVQIFLNNIYCNGTVSLATSEDDLLNLLIVVDGKWQTFEMKTM